MHMFVLLRKEYSGEKPTVEPQKMHRLPGTGESIRYSCYRNKIFLVQGAGGWRLISTPDNPLPPPPPLWHGGGSCNHREKEREIVRWGKQQTWVRQCNVEVGSASEASRTLNVAFLVGILVAQKQQHPTEYTTRRYVRAEPLALGVGWPCAETVNAPLAGSLCFGRTPPCKGMSRRERQRVFHQRLGSRPKHLCQNAARTWEEGATLGEHPSLRLTASDYTESPPATPYPRHTIRATISTARCVSLSLVVGVLTETPEEESHGRSMLSFALRPHAPCK
ncbi:uncharacterized protein [Panulirus ornatus]|uniref:uncharacterized protein n=1 Tax=Panulirus ornatus TaxID=150431 RepID=UPI003A8C608C